ncbi:hypothetical protein K443DRAFT_209319 [Laccaria amethystina LaAM-08-1]|uniref:Unplaced genomic scaffold K443scaffold_135, whole genome shotgun sequence n=1 Tax=Laccaria amethystina LaAM-08-1 TaxID=1095629 RepID=A0A0C9WZR8_9AGAR|nr:hypothetical protein K443DRAFT_209319 [Laccaria amethystina LaAM-08-1]
MRLEGLERWHVPTIMTLLPLFLQASLVLFCLGLLKFARNLNQPPVVTLTLTVVVGSIFLSVLSTAITPGFQFLESHRRFGLLTSQCPCKSPQSWAFYKLLGWPSFMPTDSSCLNHRTCQTTGARIYKYIYEIGLTGQMSSGRINYARAALSSQILDWTTYDILLAKM